MRRAMPMFWGMSRTMSRVRAMSRVSATVYG